MNKSDTSAFVNQMLVYTLVMICFSGSIGLGTVWMRQQIAQTAKSIQQVEASTEEIERRLAETTSVIAEEQSAESLNRRNTQWKLGLVQPTEQQVVRVGEQPERRLNAKRNAELFSDTQSLLKGRFLAGGSN